MTGNDRDPVRARGWRSSGAQLEDDDAIVLEILDFCDVPEGNSMTEQPLVIPGFLVVRADGTMRVTKKRVGLNIDEVAFPLSVLIPKTWGRVQRTSIDVALPEPPEARVAVGEGELDD